MSDFKDRLNLEYKDLEEKIEKLENFKETEAFQKIDPFQTGLLNIQLKAMKTYSECLLERIVQLESQEE